jgi:hypothetical protein
LFKEKSAVSDPEKNAERARNIRIRKKRGTTVLVSTASATGAWAARINPRKLDNEGNSDSSMSHICGNGSASKVVQSYPLYTKQNP